MIAKMLKALLIVLVLLTFQACSWCETKVYIDREVEVLVPVKCKVPETKCSFDRNTSTEVISSMLECMIDMKQNIKVCQ